MIDPVIELMPGDGDAVGEVLQPGPSPRVVIRNDLSGLVAFDVLDTPRIGDEERIAAADEVEVSVEHAVGDVDRRGSPSW